MIYYDNLHIKSSEPHLEVFIAKLVDNLPTTVLVAGDDGEQWHAVEGVVLDHGVDGHVTKDDAGANDEELVDGVGADGVAGEVNPLHLKIPCQDITQFDSIALTFPCPLAPVRLQIQVCAGTIQPS